MVTTNPPTTDDDMPPAYPAESTANPDKLRLSLVAQPSTLEVLVSLIPPTMPATGDQKANPRAPLDLCLVIDVSGSMDSGAPVPGRLDKHESSGLSVLDVVKHATRTIIEAMGDEDRVAIVTFSDSAEVVVPLTPMTTENRASTWNEVSGLRTKGMTNLWHGLKTGMNVVTATSSTDSDPSVGPADEKPSTPIDHRRISAVFILTDGQPNVEPPRGHIPMLRSYLDGLSPGSPKFTISTFGFGYSLDSRLLDEIADVGQGTYGFIPDSGMIGTVFIHAVSNLMATWARSCTLEIELIAEKPLTTERVEVLGMLPVQTKSNGIVIQIGDIQYGQSRDVVVKLPAQSFGPEATCTVNFVACYAPHTLTPSDCFPRTVQTLGPEHEVEGSALLHHESYRLSFIQTVADLFKSSGKSQARGPISGSQFRQSLANWIDNPLLKDHEPSTALTSDITSQVILGLEPEHWSRWGEHYIPSLARSHQRQQCSNFKDPGLQVYGRNSPLFTTTRDRIDSIFDSLPPPKPSIGQQSLLVSHASPIYSAPGVGTRSTSLSPAGNFSRLVGSRAPASPRAPGSSRKSAGALFHAQPASMQAAYMDTGSLDTGSLDAAFMDVDSMDAVTMDIGSMSALSASRRAPPPPPPPLASMSAYRSREAPCFAGWCLVDIGDNKHVKVSELCRGAPVRTPAGTARVAAVLRTICPAGVTDLCMLGRLAITPWHPIQHNDSWAFPASISKPESVSCNYIYSILLEPSTNPDAHAICIEGSWCVTLGHGSTDAVRSHPFLGNYERVVECMSRMGGYYDSDGIVEGAGVFRDNETGYVCGFEAWGKVQKRPGPKTICPCTGF